MKIGIIGYGSMGKMLLWKFSEKGKISKENLYVFNRTLEKCDEAKDIAQIVSAKEISALCDITFICVRPSDIKTVLEDIKDDIKDGALIASLNGSVSFESINAIADTRTAKVIPSLTAEIERSQTLVCYNGKVTEEDKTALKGILSCIGDVIELPETRWEWVLNSSAACRDSSHRFSMSSAIPQRNTHPFLTIRSYEWYSGQ